MLFVLLLIVAAIIFQYIKFSRASYIMLSTLLLCVLLIGDGVIPAILLNNLQAPFILPKPILWGQNNAIILLGAGAVKLPNQNVKPTMMAFSRINQAAKLYFSCIKTSRQCIVIISGGDVAHVGTAEARVYKQELQALGIKDSDMIIEENSMNTYKNAEFTQAKINEKKYDQIILVTSAIHLKRALLNFNYFGINAKPELADYIIPKFSFIPLAYNFALTDFAVHEYLGMMQFHVYNFFGWNKKDASNL